MKYIGLDIHKKDTQACVLDEKEKAILVKRVRTDVSDIGHLFGMIEADEMNLSVVMEATGFYFWIHDLRHEKGDHRRAGPAWPEGPFGIQDQLHREVQGMGQVAGRFRHQRETGPS
jgi:hypothetical protein